MPDTNQIAEYLKNQYPQYAPVPNDRLTAAFLAKYPKQIQGPAANYLTNQIQGPAANYLQNLLAFQLNQNQPPNPPIEGQPQSLAPRATPTPDTHHFSISAWQRANPNGDVKAAEQHARSQGFEVVP